MLFVEDMIAINKRTSKLLNFSETLKVLYEFFIDKDGDKIGDIPKYCLGLTQTPKYELFYVIPKELLS